MKRLLLLLTTIFMTLTVDSVFAQQGIGTLQPDKSAALEVLSTKRGVLIPRFDIPDLNQSTPVQNPAHSLLVFNIGTSSTPEGFYYWNDDGTQSGVGNWIPLGKEAETIDIIGGENIQVEKSQQAGVATYEIHLEPGSMDNQVLVTRIDDTDPLNPIAIAVWEDRTEVLLDIQEGTNAITLEPELDANNNLTGKIWIKLGGVLSETTEIQTGWDALLNQPEPTHTLAITGLESVTSSYKIMVVENGIDEGIIRTLDRSFSQSLQTSQAIDQLIGYSPYIPEINLDVNVLHLTSDIDIILPNPSQSEGQVINVQLTDPNSYGEPDAYLNIIENDGVTILSYGSLPYQAWILKSNGNQ